MYLFDNELMIEGGIQMMTCVPSTIGMVTLVARWGSAKLLITI